MSRIVGPPSLPTALAVLPRSTPPGDAPGRHPRKFERLHPLVIKVRRKTYFSHCFLPIKGLESIRPWTFLMSNSVLSCCTFVFCLPKAGQSCQPRGFRIFVPVSGGDRRLHRRVFHQVVALLSWTVVPISVSMVSAERGTQPCVWTEGRPNVKTVLIAAETSYAWHCVNFAPPSKSSDNSRAQC